MKEFKCPHCNQTSYSSSEHRDEQLVECIYCGEEYANIYYKGVD
jgi:transcription elongation factor Elf1